MIGEMIEYPIAKLRELCEGDGNQSAHTNDRKQCDHREKSTPCNAGLAILDSIYRPRCTSE